MNDFTASNGVMIRAFNGDPAQGGGLVEVVAADGSVLGDWDYLDADDMQALREFFQTEADERLGRWRWPENPDYVVYHWDQPQSAGVVVVSEAEAVPSRVLHIGADPENPTPEYRAARAFFDAHPEPKPWHDAKPGEVWELTVDDEKDAPLWIAKRVGHVYFKRLDGAETQMTYGRRSAAITAGRRVWPEVSS